MADSNLSNVGKCDHQSKKSLNKARLLATFDNNIAKVRDYSYCLV